MADIIRFVSAWLKKAMPMRVKGMSISVWKKSHNYAKLAKSLEDLEAARSFQGRTDEKQLARKIR